MSVEIPREIWNDYNSLFKLFKQINDRLQELLKIEKEKEKRRKELEREARKNNKKCVFYEISQANSGTVKLPES